MFGCVIFRAGEADVGWPTGRMWLEGVGGCLWCSAWLPARPRLNTGLRSPPGSEALLGRASNRRRYGGAFGAGRWQ